MLICNCIFLYHSVGQICSFLDFAGLLSAVDFVWPSEYVTPVIIVVSVEFILLNEMLTYSNRCYLFALLYN